MAFLVFCSGCTKSGPLEPDQPAGPCVNSGGPIIEVSIYRHTRMTAGVPGSVELGCTVQTYDCAGPITMTGATLQPPGGGTVVLAMAAGGAYTFIDPGPGWTYLPDQAYTVNVNVAGVTYTATIAPKGGTAVIPSFASGGGAITWTNPGNSDHISITPLGSGVTLSHFPNALSGAISTANTTLYPAPGSYTTHVSISQVNASSAFGPGADPRSVIEARDSYASDDTK